MTKKLLYLNDRQATWLELFFDLIFVVALGNPTTGIDYLPIEKKEKYVPPKTDVLKVILAADPDTQDYLWTILLTAGRVGEINGLEWKDINFKNRIVTLWTRKRKGGNKESRHVPMVPKLYHILQKRHEKRDPDLPWVFWHTYWSRKAGQKVKGPYKDRKKIMASLCKKAGVKYFRFHPLRHLTASLLDDLGIPIGITQRVLGHKNRRTTEIYLHSIGQADREAMEKLESIDLFSEVAVGDKNNPINMHKEYWMRKAKRPPHDQLKQEVVNLGYKGTGEKYGVSDNAVRKWLKCEN
jgi:integrase